MGNNEVVRLGGHKLEGRSTIARSNTCPCTLTVSRLANPNLFLTFTISRCKRRKKSAEYLV